MRSTPRSRPSIGRRTCSPGTTISWRSTNVPGCSREPAEPTRPSRRSHTPSTSRPTAASRRVEGSLRLNRGVLYGYQGRIGDAVADTTRALEVFEAQGWQKSAADMVHNLAWLAGRRGDIVAALRLFDDAKDRYRTADVPAHGIYPDRCEVLLAPACTKRPAGPQNARPRSCAEAATTSTARKCCSSSPERHWPCTTSTGAGERVRGRRHLRRRRTDGVDRRGRALADRRPTDVHPGQSGRSRRAAGARGRALRIRPRRGSDRCGRGGGRRRASRCIGHRRSSHRGQRRRGSPRRRGKVRLAEVQARCQLDMGRRHATMATCRSALAWADDELALLGGTELRRAVGHRMARLSQLGLRIVAAESDPGPCSRGPNAFAPTALPFRPFGLLETTPSPPRSTGCGPPVPVCKIAEFAGAVDVEMRREIHGLERRVQRHARLTAGDGPTDQNGARLDIEEVLAATTDRTLVELVEIDGQVTSIVVGHGVISARDLGPAEALKRAATLLRAVERVLRRPGGRDCPRADGDGS